MRSALLASGAVGLLAAVVTGSGEFLMHHGAAISTPSGDGLDYLRGVTERQATLGHFLGVFGAALYPIGCWHLYLMLRPAGELASRAVLLLGTTGFLVGAVWLGSRASLSTLVQLATSPDSAALLELHLSRYEPLLQFIRVTTLALSAIMVGLILTGHSRYPRWMALFNPILLIVAVFALSAIVPSVGGLLAPIALNVAFAVTFGLSLLAAMRLPDTQMESES